MLNSFTSSILSWVLLRYNTTLFIIPLKFNYENWISTKTINYSGHRYQYFLIKLKELVRMLASISQWEEKEFIKITDSRSISPGY